MQQTSAPSVTYGARRQEPYPISGFYNTKSVPLQIDVPSGPPVLPKPAWTEIEDLGDDMKFLYPVMVKIEREDDYFIASCPTFSLFVSGDTYEGALQAIKETLVDDYRFFLKHNPDKLTNSTKKLLNLYLAFFGKSLPG